MSATYAGISWSPAKRAYDAAMVGLIALYLVSFVVVSHFAQPAAHRHTPIDLLIRALGTCGLLMLHVALAIGPLARLDRRFLVLLYNRRHLGVLTFIIGLLHAVLVVLWRHAGGVADPLLSIFTANPRYGSFVGFPFEVLGFVALLVLFLMAATSHDFWLKNLGARTWKSLHMLVYFAYGLLVMHVVLGALQFERSVLYPVLVGAGALALCVLHLVAGTREVSKDRRESGIVNRESAIQKGGTPVPPETEQGGTPVPPQTADAAETEAWIRVGAIDDIHDGRARIVCAPLDARAGALPGERIAVFRHGETFSAVTNVCAHQGGPLGEGKIIDGCITCPWHGWQYKPGDGCAPPPFVEKIATYRVMVRGRDVFVDPRPLPPGTAVPPARASAPEVSA